ncbi:MAG: glycosyltransferase family 4 protein [Phycisphaerales bacterium]|nr:MAG: glycosyltransferase family 4 protein [Phycisphaerales bacterium]
MKIAMLAPISWPLPPTGYGPWEQVAHNLTEGLVRLGHEVTLFAAGGTKSAATLVATCPHALETWPEPQRSRRRGLDPATGLLEGPPDARVLEELHISACMERAAAGEFDVVHSHLQVHALGFARLIKCPLVSTLHGSAWVRAAHPMLLAYKDQPFVSISDAEREMLPELNYAATVYNGIRMEDFPFEPVKDDYLLFAGRLAPEKGPAEAIEVAQRSGRRLLMAGMIEPQYQEYYDTRIKPYVDGRNVEYLGLLSQKELAPVYRKAVAVLFLINWCEPFGLVAVEAQASGTPLIATRRGALPEIIVEGKTGFVIESIDEAVRVTERLGGLNPDDCRANAESRFSAGAMARGYERVYQGLAGRR